MKGEEKVSIPKIVHYVWVGEKKLPALEEKCLETWKKHLPDYEIREWNEANFDISSNEFCREAYAAKKYAFVSDYIRAYVLYHYGGIYLDADVELVKPFDTEMMNSDFFIGFETDTSLATAVIGCAPRHFIPQKMMEHYADIHFINTDGSMNMIPNVVMVTDLAIQCGVEMNGEKQLIHNAVFYPQTYFSPYTFAAAETRFSTNTYAIHHFDGTWCDHRTRFANSWNHRYKFIVEQKLGVKISLLTYKCIYNFMRFWDFIMGRR